ncbi:AAA family ATPase [Pigmentibacter sp. JX0631]|uniref:AAA family ATPase n=1 Tax=Pigmentibacter sp. JX0631 TaxID=2976982 RepID=UPI00246960E5|nr:AAA family ATPase [Pigmentibacter sp. JX0631]WGL61264.1 AAA family ATPase [Pigmentibacter sp. JX0631]
MNQTDNFILTKEYKRFVEFCKACHREKFIGLCYGPPGVGKTESAMKFSKWKEILVDIEGVSSSYDYETHISYDDLNTVLFTPDVSSTVNKFESKLRESIFNFNEAKERFIYGKNETPVKLKQYVETIIIDEADRLNAKGFEEIRDLYDRKFRKSPQDPQLTVILIGMPGIEKRLARFPQLYSRIGFVHSFKSLSNEEVIFIIKNQIKLLNVNIDINNFSDNEAISALTRITNGNFRLINRLLKQCIRIMDVNHLSSISKEVVEAARECLVIGNF